MHIFDFSFLDKGLLLAAFVNVTSSFSSLKFLPDVSPTTIEAVLAQMKKNSLITTIGNGRNTKYIRK